MQFINSLQVWHCIVLDVRYQRGGNTFPKAIYNQIHILSEDLLKLDSYKTLIN